MPILQMRKLRHREGVYMEESGKNINSLASQTHDFGILTQ